MRLYDSPWLGYLGGQVSAWSGTYVSWLLRDNGLPRTAAVDELWSALDGGGRTGDDPEPGALVFYSAGEVDRPYRVAFVEELIGGFPQTVEGDAPANVVAEERFVRRYARLSDSRLSDTRVSYGYPEYG